MARAPKLKVFRMAVGFHDAYVAAPSQKAAIEAWGADADVFRRGQAEIVSDPKLTKEPLARPGEIVKRLRGTAAEQIAALGETELPARAAAKGEAKAKAKKPANPPKPRPSRAALDKAERALAEAEARHAAEDKALAGREAALARERRRLQEKQAAEQAKLQQRVEEARAAHEEAMRRWRAA